MRRWRVGVLNFAMTSIQVGINPATDEDRFSFRTLHKECGTPVQQKYICPQCDKIAEETVSGFEFPKNSGNFIQVTEEELSMTFPKVKNIVNIKKFVHDDMLNEMLFLKPYWVMPDETAMYASQYAALKAVMLGKHKIGLGSVAFTDKEHPVALVPMEDGLALWTMTSPEKVRVPDWDLPLPDEMSLKLTEQVISMMEDQVEDSDFTVEQVSRRQALLDSKTAGLDVLPTVQAEPVAVVNVLDSLKESIALLQKEKKRKSKVPAMRKGTK